MKIIGMLFAARQDAAKARIKELEEQLDESKQDTTDAWERVTKQRNENARLKLQLEKAHEENAAILAGDLVVGPACWECPNSLHVYEAGPAYPPTVICRLKIRCKMFGKQAPEPSEVAATKLSEGWVNE
jgi:hypothetical protein